MRKRIKNDKRNEAYCSSCPSQPKFEEETPSFSHSRTPFDLYWNNYYKKHAEEMDYDIVPVKEDLIIEYNSCEPANSGPISHQPAGTIHWVGSCYECGQIVNYCEEADKNQFLPSSKGYYTTGDNLGPNGSTTTNFTCDQITSSTPTVRFGEAVYILENNQQLVLILNGPNGQYSIPTWDKFDEYYIINMGNSSFNNSVFLIYGSEPSIGVCVCYNANPKGLVLEQYVWADCGYWYLISNVNKNNGFKTAYGTYENEEFTQNGSEFLNFKTTNNLDIGGTDTNPIQVAVNMYNHGNGESTNIYLQYYVDGNNCYIRPIGGENQYNE